MTIEHTAAMWLHEHAEYWARIQPDAELLTTGTACYTYSAACQRVDRIASALAARVPIGGRIGILSRNSLDYILLYFAASKAGVVPVPINYRLALAEIEFILADADVQLLLAETGYVSRIDSARERLPAIRHFVLLADGPDSDFAPGWNSLESWLGKPMDTDQAYARRCQVALQVYTSGTTGRPKGAVITQAGLFAVMSQWRGPYTFARGQRMLVVAPMYHVAGSYKAFYTTVCGGTSFVMREFNPREVVRVIDEERIEVALLVPAMILACLNEVEDIATREFKNFRLLSYGAAPISVETLRRAIDVLGCEFVQAFGMTECANLTYLAPEHHARALAGEPHLLRSAGMAGPGSEIRIVDENDTPVPAGVVGEICGRGPQLMLGYWNRPEATAEALRGGWMHTGDVGSVDAEGFLYIKDRIKDMIVSGAENVYPREIEDVLFAHPAVADAAVIGVPDPRWGETVKAIVVVRKNHTATSEELIDFCRNRLAGFKCPRSIDFIDEIPRNTSGKVLKRVLREPFWKEHDRGVA